MAPLPSPDEEGCPLLGKEAPVVELSDFLVGWSCINSIVPFSIESSPCRFYKGGLTDGE